MVAPLFLSACLSVEPQASKAPEPAPDVDSSEVAVLEWLIPSTSTDAKHPEFTDSTEAPPAASLETGAATEMRHDTQVPQNILDDLASLAHDELTSSEDNYSTVPPQPTAANPADIERIDPDELRENFVTGDQGQGPRTHSEQTPPQTQTFYTATGEAITFRFIDQSVFPDPLTTWNAESTEAGNRVSQDSNGDGSPDLVVFDYDGDGIFDTREEDRNFDGSADYRCLNHDLDPSCEEVWEDKDFDGSFDSNTFDSDGDGVAEEQDLSVFVPAWTIVSCDDLDGDEAEDVCHLDWDGDGVADSSEEMVVYWPAGANEPSVAFKTAIQLIEPPAHFSGS